VMVAGGFVNFVLFLFELSTCTTSIQFSDMTFNATRVFWHIARCSMLLAARCEGNFLDF
jgi:hypothetical protein